MVLPSPSTPGFRSDDDVELAQMWQQSRESAFSTSARMNSLSFISSQNVLSFVRQLSSNGSLRSPLAVLEEFLWGSDVSLSLRACQNVEHLSSKGWLLLICTFSLFFSPFLSVMDPFVGVYVNGFCPFTLSGFFM